MADSRFLWIRMFLFLSLVCGLAGCGMDARKASAVAAESAADSQIDFAALKEENPHIFAWLYIPGTRIDCPVLQDAETDDFYSSHNVSRKKDARGAAYIELANVANLCDFNTVIHGNAPKKQDDRDAASFPFADLSLFADPAFFEEHETMQLYLDGNVLTYEIFAAYERENTSLIRNYDFTDTIGCLLFLKDMYATRDFNMNLREGWDSVTPYHFLVTLTAHKQNDPERQFVVVAVLTKDEAGTINRVMETY